MAKFRICAAGGGAAAHLQHPSGGAARRVGRHFGEDRDRRAGKHMSRSDTRGGGRADDAGKVAAAVGFSARLDDIEDRPGAAALAGTDDVESDAIDGRIFQHQAAQFLAIDRKRAAVERQSRAELNVGDWMDCKGQAACDDLPITTDRSNFDSRQSMSRRLRLSTYGRDYWIRPTIICGRQIRFVVFLRDGEKC